jgi:hypothetical protein
VPVCPFANHISYSRSSAFIKLSTETTLLDNIFPWYLLTCINKSVLQIIAVIYFTMRYWSCNRDGVYLLCSVNQIFIYIKLPICL